MRLEKLGSTSRVNTGLFLSSRNWIVGKLLSDTESNKIPSSMNSLSMPNPPCTAIVFGRYGEYEDVSDISDKCSVSSVGWKNNWLISSGSGITLQCVPKRYFKLCSIKKSQITFHIMKVFSYRYIYPEHPWSKFYPIDILLLLVHSIPWNFLL